MADERSLFMTRFIVEGGARLEGEMRVDGAKNAVLPILAAALLTDKPVTLYNCPRLKDVDNMIAILQTLGCAAGYTDGGALKIDASSAHSHVMPPALSKELRSSIFMLGPVIGRFRKAHFTYPGGCEIGNRPIDLHLSGLAMLNVKIKEEYGCIICDGSDLKGAAIHLDYPSVGATDNLMMAAVAAKGETVIYNAAREPEIEDLQLFLRRLGYQITGAGTSTVVIVGGGRPAGAEHPVMPDRIVAGTLMCAAAITGGELRLTDAAPMHLGSVTAKLREAGCSIRFEGNSIHINGPERPREIKLIETLPHPGFPTDMQAQMFALCTVADGTSIIVENVFENRFKHAAELARMGAVVTQKDRTAIIRGVDARTGAQVTARDLRGGAALTLAALKASGQSIISHAEHIDRVYDRLDAMLNKLGASIRREEDNQ